MNDLAHFITVQRGEWLRADLRLDLERGADRAGNPLAVLTLFLAPGTRLGEKDGLAVVLDEPARVLFHLDPAHLALLGFNAQRSKTRRCKRGPLVAQAMTKNPRTRTEKIR